MYYKDLVMIGDKVMVNRIVENNKGKILIEPATAKQDSKEVVMGVVLIKGKGTALNSLSDIHVGDVLAYPQGVAIKVPDELVDELRIESENVEILEYKDIIGTV